MLPAVPHRHSVTPSKNKNKIGKAYSLEYTEIPKMFFTPHHRRWRQQGNQGNNKCDNGIQSHCWNHVIRGHLQQCDPTMTPVHIVVTMYSSSLRKDATGRHGRAHKVFFAYATAWRTPKNGMCAQCDAEYGFLWGWRGGAISTLFNLQRFTNASHRISPV
jgi:hypothetical protein